jgi:valyl-tRNA synthetase
VPESWRAEFLRWMHHIHDWCVSRQLWWGHQIPAWFCEYEHVTVSRETPRECAECHSGRLRQDPDVLDTWFSSGLWPFSTFGWPEQTPALKTFYPNSVMETGFDILFFWVARMAMLGLHFMGEVPFRVVYLHAMVRDEKGEKMSKTRGNVIDPLDVTAKYGADALRFTLASMAGQGRDIKLSMDRIAGYRAFANKIWNAARFVLMNAEGYDPRAQPASVYDRWILSRFQRCADETRAALEDFRFSDAANGIYKFIWNELCDWAIELEKPALYGEKGARERAGAQASLLKALEGALRLLHPFMPFVTEEVWQRLPNKSGETIMLAPFPGPGPIDIEAESEMGVVARAIEGARSLRSDLGLPPNQRVPILLVPVDKRVSELFKNHKTAFDKLAHADLDVRPAGEVVTGTAVFVYKAAEVHLPLAGLIDTDRMKKDLASAEAELEKIRSRLDNKGFVERAPREVVEKDRARAEELVEKREKLARHLARVSEVGMEEKNPQQGQRSMDQMGTHGGPAGQQLQEAAQALQEKAKELVETAKQAMAPVVEQIAEKANEAGAMVTQKVAEARAAVNKRLAPKKAAAKKAVKKIARKAAPKKAAVKKAVKKAARKAAPKKAAKAKAKKKAGKKKK